MADRNTPQKLVWRSRIVLLTAAGVGTMSIVRALGKSKPTVWRWQQRFVAQGIAGLERDATRPGRKPPLALAVIAQVVGKTLHERPPAATQWSTRTMARAVGLSQTSVRRIWNAHGLKPHLTRGFKLSNDKRFVDKLRDVVGLYLSPPDKAMVLSVDEKSQVQALDRTQPGLPIKKGRAGTMTHDYKRHGTTSLFAALDVATGAVIGQCMRRHRHQEFLRFLRTIDQQTPKTLDLHLILDNYATHKHDKVKALARQAPALSLALHPDLGVMAQSRRALLRLDHPRAHPLRRLHLAGRTRNRHPRVSRQSQRRAQAFRVDQIGRPNPCQSGARTQRSRNPPKWELTVKLSALASLCNGGPDGITARFSLSGCTGSVTAMPVLDTMGKQRRPRDRHPILSMPPPSE